MEKEGEVENHCEFEDPLANYWGISLFPTSSGAFLPSSKPYNPDHDLDAIHNHLRSMTLRSPAKVAEQVKSIMEENPGLCDAEISSDVASDERNDVVAEEEAGEFPRQRRPALGLKRARFSLKPTKNPSIENLIPTLDIEKLKDPAEFFLAHERMENAKREIQKQMGGVSFESIQDNASTRPRQRRPGLLGNNQRSIKYKHRYPKETSNNNDYVPSSQETFGSQSLDPVGENHDKGGACPTSLENEVMDSTATEENKIDDILEGLIHCNSEDLEGDEAITLLQERLQIKPIVFEKSTVPDFPDSQVIDRKSLQENLSRPRKALSDIDNLLKGIENKTPLRHDIGCPVQQLASPTPPRSPFASLASLHMHISRSKPSVDPFSSEEIDQLTERNCSPTNTINRELNLAGSEKTSNEPNADMEDVIAVNNTSTVLNNVKDCGLASENSLEDMLRKSSNKVNVPLIDAVISNRETSLVEDTVRNCTSTSPKSVEDHSMEPGFDTNVASDQPDVDMDVDVRGCDMGERVMRGDLGRPNVEVQPENMQAFKASMPTDDTNFNLVDTLAGESNPAGLQASAVDKFTRKLDDGPDQVLQEKINRSTVLVGQKRSKLRSQNNSKGKKLQKRQSVAGRPYIEANEPCQFEDEVQAENMQASTASMPTDDADFNLANPLVVQSSLDGFQANAVDKCTQNLDDCPEQGLQQKVNDSMVPVRQKRIKSRAQKETKDKKLKRHSLAAGGTSWTSGVRKSTRIRTRPLEFWKGEKPVYGRIHESLATVIGVKCVSPGTDGKPKMKVKSYVSDKYKELLEVRSLY